MASRSRLLALVILSVVLPACSGIRHVSGPEFVRLKERQRTSSLDLLETYTARANQKVFYYEESMRLFLPGTLRRLYWAWMRELPPSEIADIRAGRNGWDGRKTIWETILGDQEHEKPGTTSLRFGEQGKSD